MKFGLWWEVVIFIFNTDLEKVEPRRNNVINIAIKKMKNKL